MIVAFQVLGLVTLAVAIASSIMPLVMALAFIFTSFEYAPHQARNSAVQIAACFLFLAFAVMFFALAELVRAGRLF